MPMRPHDVMSPSTLDAARLAGEIQAGGRSPGGPPGAWQVPLLLAADVEVWLLGWPAGQVTPAHDHGGSAVAVHAWSPRRWERRSAGRGAALLGLGGGLDGGGRLAGAAAGSGATLLGRGRAGQAEQLADGALDERHVGERVPG